MRVKRATYILSSMVPSVVKLYHNPLQPHLLTRHRFFRRHIHLAICTKTDHPLVLTRKTLLGASFVLLDDVPPIRIITGRLWGSWLVHVYMIGGIRWGCQWGINPIDMGIECVDNVCVTDCG